MSFRVLAAALLAWNQPGPQTPETPQTPFIYGGTPATACQAPTTVAMRGASSLCTGTLVHPEIVLYASHCEAPTAVRFGESTNAPARTVAIDHCARLGDGQVGPDDYAYCRLAEPVEDVPLTPVAYGCEVELVVAEAPALIAGFGQTDGGSAGEKHWAETEVVALTQMVLVGRDGTSAWSGDSGGGAFIQVPLDGSWRLFGIASGGTVAGMPIQYVQAYTTVPWVESDSGVDITPCHDVDGTWAPTQACAGFATDLLASGSWDAGCDAADPGSAASGTCGAPFGDDEGLPTVSIVAPSDGAVLPEGEPVDVEVEAADDETGIRRVQLRVDGQAALEDGVAPYVFEALALDPGSHGLVATAEDLAGNLRESDPVEVFVGDAEDGTSTGTGMGTDGGAANGCGCTAREGAHGAGGRTGQGTWTWALLAVVGIRRRRALARGR